MGEMPALLTSTSIAAEVAVDVIDERLELVPTADVARAAGSLGPLRPQRRGDLVACLGLAADDDHVRAAAGECAHHGEARARACRR